MEPNLILNWGRLQFFEKYLKPGLLLIQKTVLRITSKVRSNQKKEEKTPKPRSEGCCQYQELNNISGYLLLWK
jgi:hypothetical protein